MRGAKSNALFVRRANRNAACPYVALVVCAKTGLASPSFLFGSTYRTRTARARCFQHFQLPFNELLVDDHVSRCIAIDSTRGAVDK